MLLYLYLQIWNENEVWKRAMCTWKVLLEGLRQCSTVKPDLS